MSSIFFEVSPILGQIDLTARDNLGAPYDGGGNLLVWIVLIFLFAAMGAAMYWFKRFGSVRVGSNGHLDILETRPLGGRQFLVVGKYGKQSFLLGVCQGRIDYLCSLEDPDSKSEFAQKLDDAGGLGPIGESNR